MMPARLGVWPPLPLGVYGRRPASRLPFPLEDARCSLFSRARHGLHLGVAALGLLVGDEILMPAYHHGSEVEALLRHGLVPVYYEATAKLIPHQAELERLISERTRALYLTHYLGFPQDARRWRAWCDQHGLLLIEDAAQTWLADVDGEPVGSLGDLSLFCLYKTYGLPDGAAVLARGPVGAADAASLRLTGIMRRHAAAVLARSGRLSKAALAVQRPSDYDAQADFALGEPSSAPTSALGFLLRRLVESDAAAGRRAHYAELLEHLADEVPEALRELPPGASPFAFPLLTDRKEELLARLAEGGIGGLDLWSVPHPSVPPGRFPAAAALRKSIVGLPVHQELRPADVERIIDVAKGRTRRRGRESAELVTSLDELRPEWGELAAASGNIFATWAWTATWWRHFQNGNDLRVWACRSADGRLFAILPLQVSAAFPLRTLRFLGYSHGDHLGPICAPADRARAAAALRRVVLEERCDLVLGEKMPADEGWDAHLGARVLQRTGSPVLRFNGRSWDELLAHRSANFRSQVRRRERRLGREHAVNVRLSVDRAQLEEDLDTLFGLNAARWPGERWFAGTTEAFHREFASVAFDQGWLRLWILELDGNPAAAWYGFRFQGAEFYYQAGRDPAFDHLSVGFVLLSHTIRAALEDGLNEYRFLEGGESYKYRFADVDPGLETVALGRSALGRAAVSAATALRGRSGAAALGRRIAG